MKLEVSHKEIVAGLTQFLASQGITGFDPSTCQVTFSMKRGTSELSAVLDTDPAPAAPAEEKPAKAKPAAEKPADKPAEEPKADPAPETQADIDTQSGVEPEVSTTGGDDDNLFD